MKLGAVIESLRDKTINTSAELISAKKDEVMRKAIAKFVGKPDLTEEDILRGMDGRVSIEYQPSTGLERLICDGTALLEILPQRLVEEDYKSMRITAGFTVRMMDAACGNA